MSWWCGGTPRCRWSSGRCWRWAALSGCPPWSWPALIPTTLAGHSYWAIEDPAARKIQRIQFHKNLAMIGGLLFAVLDEPSPRL